MFRCTASLLISCSLIGVASAEALPAWVGEVSVTPADAQGFATVSLGGVWGNACVPGGITHEIDEEKIQLNLTHPGAGTPCLQVLTDWSVQHRIGPLDDGTYAIFASLYGFDLRNPGKPQLELGPDLLVEGYQVSLPPPPPADLTGERFVDFDDLAVLLSNWNLAGATAAQGNFVQPDETTIDFDDLAVLLAAWTGPPPATEVEAVDHPVPEPSTLALAVFALLATCLGNRRHRKTTRSH